MHSKVIINESPFNTHTVTFSEHLLHKGAALKG